MLENIQVLCHSSIKISKEKVYNTKKEVITLMEWKDVTNYFTEEQRHYKNTYLEIDYVGNDKIESLRGTFPDACVVTSPVIQ